MADVTTPVEADSLQEIFADPIMQIMMDHDGVTREEVTNLLRAMRRRAASRADGHRKTGGAHGPCRSGIPLGRPGPGAIWPSANTDIDKQPSGIG